ncbi:hypothetical protein [Hyalangium gracile]|uniref:hypothetical protein n=1 Tax=Hyalangium gracile TaxID=394092 RepID=UPI001CCAC203|nr:hypothetical protein [Hyalangium gracile]
MSSLPRLIALATTLLLVPLARGESANPDLPRARMLFDRLRYPEASRALDAARAHPGNDRDTLLQILEMQGVVAAMLQQPAKARTAFQTLLVLSPEHRLEGDYAPRVVTPFFEAKAWVGDHGALRLEPEPEQEGPTPIERVTVRVAADPLKLGRAVRFHLRAEGADWSLQEVPLAKGEASAAVKGARVQWWAELLDERQAVLALVGSATAPLLRAAPRPQAALNPPLTPTQDTPSVEKRSSATSTSAWRKLAYVSLGVAAGTGAAGGYFGLRSRSARSQLEGAAVNEQGLTTGLTQREAFELDERARSNARLANVLFGIAGATAIAGGTLWLLGTPVTVSATPAGVTVGGELP